MSGALRRAALTAALISVGDAQAALDPARLDALAAAPAWRALLHVAPDSDRSEVLSAEFFIAPQGARDPRAELDATLDALQADAALGEAHAACRYPARAAWLRRELPDRAWPAPTCAAFRAFLARNSGDRAWISFPSAFMGAPQSMFGHTMLRIERSDAGGGARLTSTAINFAADLNGARGFGAIVAGASGGLESGYSVVPYFEKVHTYADLESRDVWEYPLALEAAEIAQAMAHAWELRDLKFRYRFVDENCSYHLLTLLEVARPGLELRAGFQHATIPIDTVRALQRVGLIRAAPEQHPSLAALLRERLSALSAADRETVFALADGATTATAEPGLRAIAYNLIDYRIRRGSCPLETCTPRARALLAAPAQSPAATGPPRSIALESPDAAHGTTRATFGAGGDDAGGIVAFGWRFLGHDLLDRGSGIMNHGSVSFLDLELRAVEDSGLQLERLGVLELRACPPHDGFSRARSWSLAAAFERRLDASGRPLGLALDAGLGPPAWTGEHLLAFATGGLRLTLDDDLADAYALAVQLELGARWAPAPRFRIVSRFRRHATLSGAAPDGDRAELGVGFTLAPQLELRLQAAWEDAEPDLMRDELLLGLAYYR